MDHFVKMNGNSVLPVGISHVSLWAKFPNLIDRLEGILISHMYIILINSPVVF